METLSALLALCEGNSPVAGEFPSQRPVTRSFAVFFDLCLNKRLSKERWGWWFETLSCPLWRDCNARQHRGRCHRITLAIGKTCNAYRNLQGNVHYKSNWKKICSFHRNGIAMWIFKKCISLVYSNLRTLFTCMTYVNDSYSSDTLPKLKRFTFSRDIIHSNSLGPVSISRPFSRYKDCH